jgi:hypothetical protein
MKKSLITIGLAASLILVLTATFYLARKRATFTGKTERKSFTILLKPATGGSCAYRTVDLDNVCVDYTDAQRIISDYSDQGANNNMKKKITVDADIHYSNEKLSPSTPEPQFRNEKVLHFDKVYSTSTE